jgi:methylenetetrahydrofolate dehydrogenase (NADP+)/methenyltetrahydrofolate cyclohydrolase
MTAQIINGKEIAQQLRISMKDQVEELKKMGVTPGLAVVILGEDPASQSYVKAKIKACEEIGVYSKCIRLPMETKEAELLQYIEELNNDQDIHGILVQLPLPKHIAEKAVIDAISPEKDVDGFHPVNVGNMLIGDECYLPCTPHGIVKMIQSTGTTIAGKNVVVVGRSNIVGKPVSMLLLQEHATVTICHSRTAELSEFTKKADILIVAIGKAGVIGKEHVSEGTIVIDVGVNRTEEGKLVGDVQFEQVSEVASHITPVPGGVGPMTITMLLFNTLESAKFHHKKSLAV